MARVITMLALAAVVSGGRKHLGCYGNRVRRWERRGVYIWKSNSASVDRCSTLCAKHKYFGVENYGQCWCGDSLKEATKKGRTKGCKNGKGAPLMFDLYQDVADVVKAKVAQSPPKCTKDLCYYHDEKKNPRGPYKCNHGDNCGCHSMRTCSRYGWCSGRVDHKAYAKRCEKKGGRKKPTVLQASAVSSWCNIDAYDGKRIKYPGTSSDNYLNYCVSSTAGACGVKFCNTKFGKGCRNECLKIKKASAAKGAKIEPKCVSSVPAAPAKCMNCACHKGSTIEFGHSVRNSRLNGVFKLMNCYKGPVWWLRHPGFLKSVYLRYVTKKGWVLTNSWMGVQYAVCPKADVASCGEGDWFVGHNEKYVGNDACKSKEQNFGFKKMNGKANVL